MRILVPALALTISTAAVGCDEEPQEPPAPPAESEAAGDEPATPSGDEADPSEACARVLVVAWDGAEYASSEITRSKEEARSRAAELRGRIDAGEDFAELARAESDAASSGPRGGLMGTYARDEWPLPHEAIEETVFALPVGELSDLVEAPYGYVVARRCAVEKVHTRHILVRYAGARNAGDEVTRTKSAARTLADEIRAAVMEEGADFEGIARERSEDSSAERGGDLGEVGRGRLAPAYEEAAFALSAGGVSEVVETEFGFHVIQRAE